MKLSELKEGQEFIIRGKKTPHGFITVIDGLTHYEFSNDIVVEIVCKDVRRFVDPDAKTHSFAKDGKILSEDE